MNPRQRYCCASTTGIGRVARAIALALSLLAYGAAPSNINPQSEYETRLHEEAAGLTVLIQRRDPPESGNSPSAAVADPSGAKLGRRLAWSQSMDSLPFRLSVGSSLPLRC
jgi:hypothetical protein